MTVLGPPPRIAGTAVPIATIVALVLFAGLQAGPPSHGQAKVDFARDIQPLLKERCFECHGPTKQNNGYRLDRRSIALSGVVRPNIVPRSSETSRLIRRVTGPESGPQMPPDDQLTRDEIDVLKRWIDEGAEWPDAFANEREFPPQDPAATRMTELIRSGSHKAVLETLEKTPAIVNGRGPGGSTPLMYAVLYGDASLVAAMLQPGADPNIRNHAGASALTWAVDDVDKVRLLVDRGADVNASSDFGRTPLMIAAAQTGSAPTVKLLLDRGAKVSSAALTSAAGRGDAAVVRLLLAAGARDNPAAGAAAAALRANCRDCLDAIVASHGTPGADPKAEMPNMRTAIFGALPPQVALNPEALRQAIERGGDVNASDAKSRSVLMLASISDALPAESVRLLIERGADARVKDPKGLTAVDFASRLGHTPVVDALVSAGATPATVVDPTFTLVPNNTIRGAIDRSLPLLQRTGLQFYEKSGCVSCHHNSLTAVTIAAARGKGITVDEKSARQELTTVVKDVEATREQALQGIVSPGGFVTTTGYILIGLSAERHQPGVATDALVRLLKVTQLPDGHWRSPYRPPMEASEFTATAVSLRGIQLYGRGSGEAGGKDTIRAATSWLQTARPKTTEDRVFRLLGLTWAAAPAGARQSAIRDLVETQRQDGGWSQLPSLRSDAYATGEALVALHEAGVREDDAVYRRGVRFLLTTQLADGSWFVRTRAHPTQVYFESGFPHAANQYISAAATNWATLALVHALPSTNPSRTSRPQRH
jgi:ankyrin repeat protein